VSTRVGDRNCSLGCGPELVTRTRQLKRLVDLDRYRARLLDEIERRRAES
jgi:hypothetical protein